jgi:broad-specificity NMP kinase
MPEIIVSFAGQPGSGKTTAVSLLERRFGFEGVRPSRVIRNYAQEHGIALGVDRSLWAEMRRRLGEERGPDWLTQAILTSPSRAVALDGLRTVGDYSALPK